MIKSLSQVKVPKAIWWCVCVCEYESENDFWHRGFCLKFHKMTTMSIAQVRVIKIAEIADELANKPTGYSPNDTIGDFSFARRLDIFNRIGITREQVILLLYEDIKGDISAMKEVMTYSRIHIAQNPQLVQNFCGTVASVNCLTSTACGRCFHSSSFGWS